MMFATPTRSQSALPAALSLPRINELHARPSKIAGVSRRNCGVLRQRLCSDLEVEQRRFTLSAREERAEQVRHVGVEGQNSRCITRFKAVQPAEQRRFPMRSLGHFQPAPDFSNHDDGKPEFGVVFDQERADPPVWSGLGQLTPDVRVDNNHPKSISRSFSTSRGSGSQPMPRPSSISRSIRARLSTRGSAGSGLKWRNE